MTLKSDMLRALEDDANDNLKDVTLVGSDGGRVSANKAVLAIRSPVFQRMFFGNFQERDSDEVKMDNYPSIVLQVVVKYCYVDELDLDLIYSDDHNNNKTNTTANTNQDEQDEEEEEEVDRLTDAEAVALVQVRDAANYLELFELHKTISNELGESILSTDVGLENQRKDLACVCAVLQELMARGGSDGSLFLTLLDLVETHPEPCLLPKFSTTHNQGILACSLALLERLLQSPSVNAFVAVKALQKWNKEHNQNSSEDDDDEELTQLQTIANGVQLEQLSAPQLAEIPPCSLFSMERLYKAFVSLSKSHGPSPKPSPPFVARSATAFTFGNSSSPNSSSCNQNSPDRTAKTATIRGAGVECVNGVYHLVGLSSSYQRRGTYGDLAGCFLLERAGVSGAWKIVFESETTEQTNKFFNKFCLYESTSISNNKPGIPPFALWRCLDGKDPTPYVSVQVKMADPFAAAHCYSMGGGAANASTSDNNPLPDAPSSAQVQMAEAFRAQLAVANQNSNNNNNVDGDYNRQVRRRNVRGRRQRDN
ncbi:expressed unknown protein [Seminavis robusta]|uniref:BTB domain-containing protein n=1 Tax=Seminavis robusta TaxID=568900 RepID=A0A9N8DTA5_9STRA|nr:expressed unknown protein [Seminavis robusta]|eukprot:Sro265_g102800.1 n/a (538) ;mRNA; f:41030-42643